MTYNGLTMKVFTQRTVLGRDFSRRRRIALAGVYAHSFRHQTCSSGVKDKGAPRGGFICLIGGSKNKGVLVDVAKRAQVQVESAPGPLERRGYRHDYREYF